MNSFTCFFSRKDEREKNGADSMPQTNKLQVNRDATHIFIAKRTLYSVHRIYEPLFVISCGKRSLSV